jgi:hypothetical protein
MCRRNRWLFQAHDLLAERAVKNEQKFWGVAEITLDDDAIHK